MSFEPRENPNDNGQILNAMSRWLLWPVAVTVVVIIGFAFVLSFQSQVDLAIAARIREDVAFGWPIVVDGTILVSTFAAFILHARRPKVAWYPWAVLILFGALSIWANGIHATGATPTDGEIFIVGAVPAIGLLLSTHLLVLMLSPGPKPRQAVAAAEPRTAQVLVAAEPAPMQAVAESPATVQPALMIPAVTIPAAEEPVPAHGRMSSTARPSTPTPRQSKKIPNTVTPVQSLSRTEASQMVRDRAEANDPISASELAGMMNTSEQRAQNIIDQTT
ncbi:DUF2637 domain-containing protein [Agromyces sp. NPDC057679]|uniref:DUF2637 domain-containing protein n=1 Tax=Agromyces sp. NPDC057679 TaxID=3346207 RepID=UPI00366AB0C2